MKKQQAFKSVAFSCSGERIRTRKGINCQWQFMFSLLGPEWRSLLRTRATVSIYVRLFFHAVMKMHNDILNHMNEQPQPRKLQQNASEGEEHSLYQANGEAGTSYNGFDLTQPSLTETPDAQRSGSAPTGENVVLSWDASEYVHHSKGTLWYVGFIAIVIVLLATAYFLTHEWTFVVLVIVMAAAMAVFAQRPPHTLHYALSDSGVRIEQKFYYYADFRAFGIIADGALFSIMLIPTKRFSPAVNIYFAEQDGEKIVDILGARLPMEELHLDFVDLLMRRLRF
jgi:hypothetical protein